MTERRKSFRLEIRREAQVIFDRDGVTAMEYGLLTGLIALIIVGAVTLFSGNANTLFTHIANTI
ncbi:MAG: Flp family type IVb pilin [Stellaceae bacterium]